MKDKPVPYVPLAPAAPAICPHCQRTIPPDMAHICTGHLTPPRESHPEIMRRVRATLATSIRLLDGNLYDHAAARAHLVRLLQELDADE